MSRALSLHLSRALFLSRTLDFDFSRTLEKSRDFAPELKQLLQILIARLPNPKSHRDKKEQWWKAHGQAWREELRAVAIEYRDIGHDWQFTNEQKELLQQYRDANKLLVDCLQQSYTSRAVREDIEATLLLPRSAWGNDGSRH